MARPEWLIAGRVAVGLAGLVRLGACAMPDWPGDGQHDDFVARVEAGEPRLARHRTALIYRPPLPSLARDARDRVDVPAYFVDRPQASDGTGDLYYVVADYPTGRVRVVAGREDGAPLPRAPGATAPGVMPSSAAVARYRALTTDPAFLAAQARVLGAYVRGAPTTAPAPGPPLLHRVAAADCESYQAQWARIRALDLPFLHAGLQAYDPFFADVRQCARAADPQYFAERFAQDLRAELPVGGGAQYTPPVPAPDATPEHPTVLVFRIAVGYLPFRPRYVYPPDRRLRVAYPSGVVERVDDVAARDVGLVPDPDNGSLGQYLPPELAHVRTAEAWQALQAAFADAETEILTSYFARRPPAPAACHTYLGQLRAETPQQILPVLRAASPAFFAALDRCVDASPRAGLGANR